MSQTVPTENAVQANRREAQRLLVRGVAAARAGQKRVAAGLLTRAVQLDTQLEGAWLWLSGVLDDPQQIAFCLRSVLALNPHSEPAQRGLRYLEERGLLVENRLRSPAPLALDFPEEVTELREARHHGEAWWVNWRRSRQALSRARLIAWSVPLLLLALILPLHTMMSRAVEQRMLQVEQLLSATPEPAVPIVQAAVLPGQQPILEQSLQAVRQAEVISYLTRIAPLREQLRSATENYRSATAQPGGAVVTHAAAARSFRDQLLEVSRSFAAITPPEALQQAHQDYLTALALELAALDDILSFYSSYQLPLFNRAALRFQEAGLLIDQSRQTFESQLAAIGSAIPPRTFR